MGGFCIMETLMGVNLTLELAYFNFHNFSFIVNKIIEICKTDKGKTLP